MTAIQSLTSFINVFEKAARGRCRMQTFDDFLTLCFNTVTRRDHHRSYYEEEKIALFKRYHESGSYEELMKLALIFFGTTKLGCSEPDMLGDVCRYLISDDPFRNRETPFKLCCEITEYFQDNIYSPSWIFDTNAGSGRMLLAFARNSGLKHRYLGVDRHPISAKLAAMNMFMQSMEGEIICADIQDMERFYAGYRVSFEPEGIFRVNMEESLVLKMYSSVFAGMRKENPGKRMLFYHI